jgi:hypothetical protein
MTARFCAECSRELPAGARSDARYCGSTCRNRAFRSQRGRLADTVKDWLGGQTWTDVGVTRLDDLMSRTARGVQPWRAQAEQLAAYQPAILEAFGMPTLIAAAMPMPAGVCRTCFAVGIAQIRDQPLPIPDAATAALLGPLCSRCLPTLRAAATARMPAKTRKRPPVSSSRRSSLFGAAQPGHLPHLRVEREGRRGAARRRCTGSRADRAGRPRRHPTSARTDSGRTARVGDPPARTAPHGLFVGGAVTAPAGTNHKTATASSARSRIWPPAGKRATPATRT